MMKFIQINLFVCMSTAIFILCSGSGFAASQGSRPEDFGINFKQTAGSVPPPYYNEFTIVVAPSGKAEITLTPDYPAPAVPKWTETFQVSAKQLDETYNLMKTEQAFTFAWREPSPPLLGAAGVSIKISANGQQVEIPPQVAKDQNSRKSKISKAVMDLVPEPLWTRLKERHLDYAKEHYPHGAE